MGKPFTVPRLTHTQAHAHAGSRTRRLTHTQAHAHAGTRTRRHTHTQAHAHAGTRTRRHTHKHTQAHPVKAELCVSLFQSYQKLKEIAQECQASQIKKLKEICEKEKKELQKILDRKRQNSIIEAKKGDKEKAESELNEINRKHIQESVSLILRLDEAQEKRQERLKLQQRDIVQKLEEEQQPHFLRLQRDCEAELDRLPEEICCYLQGELETKGLRSDALFSQLPSRDNAGSGPPSNCSTPPFPSPSHSWSQSLDHSTTLGDSSSSSTPVTSESELTAV
ncbi:1-phosphatidylinositol 4,5-bisphosphate phosphodiesterase beta-3 [Brachyhypopomus gauderio]|uniref:1-phosphatidylinositol 4,5-bisphosphate phosphodiesterase beta-3 n=1 Tax=Brachyhypopomus gauderio TaxID=698409 RepID=UPI004041EAF2